MCAQVLEAVMRYSDNGSSEDPEFAPEHTDMLDWPHAIEDTGTYCSSSCLFSLEEDFMHDGLVLAQTVCSYLCQLCAQADVFAPLPELCWCTQ